MPEWNKIQVTNKAIRIATCKKNISEEDAFDFLLYLLENAEHSKYKGIDQKGVEVYRLENDYLFIKNKKFVRYDRRRYFSKRVRNELHHIEDGRCEECGRAMDKSVVRIQRKNQMIFNDINNYVLLCPDCDNGEQDLLIHAKFERETIISYQLARNSSFEDAYNELLITQNNLVLIRLNKTRRLYWAPGLGTFSLKENVLKLDRLEESPSPLLERRPQERSRRRELTDT